MIRACHKISLIFLLLVFFNFNFELIQSTNLKTIIVNFAQKFLFHIQLIYCGRNKDIEFQDHSQP